MPVVERTSLVHRLLTAAGDDPPPIEPRLRDDPVGAARPVRWPAPPDSDPSPAMSLQVALDSRRTVGGFGVGALAAAELSRIVATGLAAERRQWPAGTHPGLELSFALAAFDVADLEPGLYLSDWPENDDFIPLHRESWTQELRSRYIDAPAMILICGSIERACQDMGAPGYGQLLVRAAAAGHAAWLQAIACGLVASRFDRACHQVTDSLSRPRSSSLQHLLTLAVGRPLAAVRKESTRQ
jgi:hypothetical protein